MLRGGVVGREGIVASVALLLAAAACDRPPVAWEPQHPVAAVEARTATDTAAAPRAIVPPADSTGLRPCVGSVVTAASGRGAERYTAWWALRPDSSALLMAAYAPDSTREWSRVFEVDTLDRSARGCDRPRPALAADRANGYAHAVYWLEAPEGPGVFYAHLMDPRARFEPPSVIVYGRSPARASVASLGDAVAVAYEDPNRSRPQVDLALSRTAGHAFEERAIDVSSGDVEARAPLVTLAPGGRVTVRWTERGGPDAPEVRAERRGVLRAAKR